MLLYHPTGQSYLNSIFHPVAIQISATEKFHNHMINDIFKDLILKFTQHLEGKKRSPSTILAYRADLEQISAFLLKKGKVSPSQVIQSDIETFRDLLLNQKYSPKSVSRKLNAVKTFYRWLMAEKLVTSDPSEIVSHPKIQLIMPKFLLPLEYRALRDVVRGDNRITAIIELILQTGLRISEVSDLKLENIGDTEIKVETHATQPERVIPLNKPAKKSLEEYLQSRPKSNSPYVFISKYGKPLAVRNIRAAVVRYLQRAEIGQYSVNDLRTTFIVENLKNGVGLAVVSQAVGHKRVATTEKYLELAEIKKAGKKQVLAEL
ncbi:tyrosine-type recombinase/integrase [Patescibacteria group bacterium]|nr:tyrosine-type recombinase/integrase [Patescibacteria group bacterium]